MTLAELVSEARQDLLGDTVADYLWSDAQLTRYAEEAIKEACQRTPLIIRVRNIAVTAGTAEYTLNEFTRQIYTAKLDLEETPLKQTTDAELSLCRGSQWREREDTPTHYMRRGHKITLFPKPIVNDTLVIKASSIPDDDFDIEDDIDPAYHKDLLYYIAYKAYMFPDADTYNPAKARDYLNMFTERFGVRHTAKYESVAFDSPMYGTVVGGRMA